MKKLITIILLSFSLFCKAQTMGTYKDSIITFNADSSRLESWTMLGLIKQNRKFSNEIDSLQTTVGAVKHTLDYIMSFVNDDGEVINDREFKEAVILFKTMVRNARKNSEFQRN